MKKILFFASFAIVAAVFAQPRTTQAASCQINVRITSNDSSTYSSTATSNGVVTSTVNLFDGTANQTVTLNWNSNGNCGSALELVDSGGNARQVAPRTYSDNTYVDSDGNPEYDGGGTPVTLYYNPGGGLSYRFNYLWDNTPAPYDPTVVTNYYGAGGWFPLVYNTSTGRTPRVLTFMLMPYSTYSSCVSRGTDPMSSACDGTSGGSGGSGPDGLGGTNPAIAQVVYEPSSDINITNSCNAGGTWTISPTGQSGSNSQSAISVQPDPSGTTYTVSFVPPSGYLGSVSSPASQTLYGGDSASFATSCSPQVNFCPDRSPAPDNNVAECPCPAPTTDTQTLDCSTAHGAGYTGAITQQRTKQPPYPDCPWSSWTTTSDTCVANCTPPLTQTQKLSCGAGYTGSIVQQQTKSAATDNPACTFGAWTTISNTCVPVPTSTINVSSNLPTMWSLADNLGNTVGSTNGSETSDSYTVSPQPGGTAYTISPGSLSGYTLDTSNTVTGQGSTFTLFGINDSGTFNLLYTAVPPPFTYSLSNSGDASTVQGQPTQEVITKTLTGGSQQAVGLSVPSTPPGVSVTGISAQDCTLTCDSTITLSVAGTVTPGQYSIEVDGTPNNQTTHFNLNVAPTPNINVTCNANPAVAKVGQSVSWTASATGGSGSYVNYSWSGSDIPTAPNVPTSNPYAITYSTVGSKSAAATVTDSNGKTGTCTAGTAVVNVNPTFQEF